MKRNIGDKKILWQTDAEMLIVFFISVYEIQIYTSNTCAVYLKPMFFLKTSSISSWKVNKKGYCALLVYLHTQCTHKSKVTQQNLHEPEQNVPFNMHGKPCTQTQWAKPDNNRQTNVQLWYQTFRAWVISSHCFMSNKLFIVWRRHYIEV